MVHEIACLLRNEGCKDIIRATKSPTLRVTFFHHIKDLITKIQKCNFALILIEESQISNNFPQYVSGRDLSHSTIIVTPEFNKYYFQKYVKLGFTYIIDTETFIYLIPTILENLQEFLHSSNCANKEIMLKGVTVSIAMGYLILRECKIFAPRSALILLVILLRSDGYLSLQSLQPELERRLNRKIAESHITVTISRLNRDIHNATGMKIIKNRYGFGYYVDL